MAQNTWTRTQKVEQQSAHPYPSARVMRAPPEGTSATLAAQLNCATSTCLPGPILRIGPGALPEVRPPSLKSDPGLRAWQRVRPAHATHTSNRCVRAVVTLTTQASASHPCPPRRPCPFARTLSRLAWRARGHFDAAHPKPKHADLESSVTPWRTL